MRRGKKTDVKEDTNEGVNSIQVKAGHFKAAAAAKVTEPMWASVSLQLGN